MLKLWSVRKLFCAYKAPIEAIKKLREQTSAPIGQCKTALQQTKGDHSQALAWLKAKGLAAASKRADKQTRQGVIGSMVTSCRSKVVIVQVNCQTDFVAKNQLFLNFVNNIMCRAIEAEYLLNYEKGEQDKDAIDAFLEDCPMTQLFPQDKDINNLYEEYKIVIARLQQNIRVRRIVTLHSDKYKYGIYVHQPYQDFVGMQASVVQIESEPQIDIENEYKMQEFGQFADNIATQVLGSPPKYYNIEDIPKQIIQSQTERVKKQMAQRLTKAPQNAHKRMIEGKLNASFYEECLLHKMPYILSNDGIPVQQYWKQIEKDIQCKFRLNKALFWQCK